MGDGDEEVMMSLTMQHPEVGGSRPSKVRVFVRWG
jgi:hypothetical protein